MGETDADVNAKVQAALKAELMPIVCVGESLEQRELGITSDWISMQIKCALSGVPEEKIRSRYQRSLANLPALAEIADLLRVVDNSGDAPELIYEVSDAGRQIFENQHWSNSEILNFVG